MESNHASCVLQHAQFLSEYNAWWMARTNVDSPSLAFTSFMFEVCACTAQCPSIELHQKIAYELTEDVQQVSKRLHEAAAELGNMVSPGAGGVYLALQGILAASWYKAEGKFREAWRALALTVHEQQESGTRKRSRQILALCHG